MRVIYLHPFWFFCGNITSSFIKLKSSELKLFTLVCVVYRESKELHVDNNGIDRYEDTDAEAYSREKDSLNMPNFINVHPWPTLGYEVLT